MCKKSLTLTFWKKEISLQWSSKTIAGLLSPERSLKLKRMGLSSVTGRDLKIRNGYLTRFPHVEGMKAGYGHSNYQKVASYVSDLRWMIVQTESFYQEWSLIWRRLTRIRTNSHLRNNDLTRTNWWISSEDVFANLWKSHRSSEVCFPRRPQVLRITSYEFIWHCVMVFQDLGQDKPISLLPKLTRWTNRAIPLGTPFWIF